MDFKRFIPEFQVHPNRLAEAQVQLSALEKLIYFSESKTQRVVVKYGSNQANEHVLEIYPQETPLKGFEMTAEGREKAKVTGVSFRESVTIKFGDYFYDIYHKPISS